MATAAAMGRLALPEMLKYKYNPGLAAGVIAASGTLGSLIPPSILMVIYGIFTEQPISKLLVAGILPGLLTAFAYTVLIMVRCTINPELAPKIEETVTWKERFQSLKGVWAIPVLALSVIGSIYSGIATPTEAGAIGAFMAMVIAMLTGNGSFKVIAASVKEALFSLSSIFFIAIGAVMLTRFLVLAGIPDYLVELMGVWSVDPMLLVIGSLIIFIILGMFLDPLGLMLVTIPILLPLYEALDINLIWMGVLVIKYLEVGLLTPPVGLNAYVVKGVAGDSVSLVTIFKGISWFLLAEVFVIALLIIFPEISLYLPSLMD
jgi:tripartite ATP-independent transporter DctM subunit